MSTKDVFYILACISYCMIIGAGMYEHIAVWPIAYSEPPKSLTMFQGDFAIYSEPFWMTIHPIILTLYIITLVVNWKTERRKFIVFPLITYILVLAITAVYFVPELINLTETPYAVSVDPALQDRGSLWITLSLIRMFFIVASAVILLFGLTKSENARLSQTK